MMNSIKAWFIEIYVGGSFRKVWDRNRYGAILAGSL
jgi:hypothetical protein